MVVKLQGALLILIPSGGIGGSMYVALNNTNNTKIIIVVGTTCCTMKCPFHIKFQKIKLIQFRKYKYRMHSGSTLSHDHADHVPMPVGIGERFKLNINVIFSYIIDAIFTCRKSSNYKEGSCKGHHPHNHLYLCRHLYDQI